MTVLDLQIATGADDGWVRIAQDGTQYFPGMEDFSRVRIGKRYSSTSSANLIMDDYYRFVPGVSLQGAVIDVAYCQLVVVSADSASPPLYIYYEDAASPAQISSYADYWNRTRSATRVSWTGGFGSTGTKTTPSLVALLQALVDSRNPTALQLFIQNQSRSFLSSSTANSQNEVRNYESIAAESATLHIEYTPPNTAPSITGSPTVSYGSRSRLGPNNSPAVVAFTATDPEQAGADQLSYTIRTAAVGGGTLVASGACTAGVIENVNIAFNASGLSGNGSQTLYLLVSDGTDTAETSFVLLQDNAAPTVGTISHTPNPVLSTYSATFTLTDTQSTFAGELAWQVRTAAAGSGTLLVSGTTTSAVEVTTGTINDAGLVDGTNTRYLYVTDGSGNALDQSFTVEADLSNPLPVLTSINPASKAATTSGFTLTATGSDFVGASVVRWDGVDLVTTFVSDTTLTATVDAALIASEGTASVTVFSPAPDGGESAAQTFTIGPPPPTSSIPVASVRRSQPRFYLALYPPLGSTNAIERTDTYDINPDTTGVTVRSTLPGGWSEMTIEMVPVDNALIEPLLPDETQYRVAGHVTLTDGAFTLFEGRLGNRVRVGGRTVSFRAGSYGYEGTRDIDFTTTSTTVTTSGQVLRAALASAAPFIRPATGDDYVDPQVAHAPVEWNTLFVSQILEQIVREGNTDGQLMDWAVWENQTLHLKPRVPPSRPDYWIAFDPDIVLDWQENTDELRGAVRVQYTSGGIQTTTEQVIAPGFIDRYGIQRSITISAGEMTEAAALRIARTYLARYSQPIVSATLEFSADDYLTGYGGQPIPPYMARAGQWVQVGDQPPLVAIDVAHDLTGKRTTMQLGDQGESYAAMLAQIERDVLLRQEGLNPNGGRTR